MQELFDLTKDITVLYVEDDAVLQEEMANVFNDLFQSVDLANDGADALRMYHEYQLKNKISYDLIITDINMPNMNGIELCQEIIADNPDQHIIVMSAHNESEYLFKLINLGISSFILKPVNMSNIISVLKKSAKAIQAEHKEHHEQQQIKRDNLDLVVANEELEQQVKIEMYNADNNISILQQYKDAIDKMLLVSKTDPQGIITYANEHFCRLSGYSLEELIGQRHSIVRHPDNPSSLFKNMWEKLNDKKPWHGLLKNRAKNGSAYFVQSSIIPLLDARGKLIEYIALREDVTANINYQKRLEEKNKRIDAVLDNQESIILLINAQYEKPLLTHINAKFFEHYEYQNINDFKNKHRCICELFIVRKGYMGPSSEEEHWTEKLLNEPDIFHKVLMLDKFNEEKTYSVHLKQLQLENEDFYLVTFTDITEIDKLRLIAEEAEKAKSAFLANMSHEIRTPINGINGFTQLLKNSELTEKQHHFVDLIDVSTQLLIGTINDILDFSKIESKKMELSYSRIDLVKEMEDFSKLFLQKAKEKSITFELHLDPELYPYVSVDTLHLKQILSNLISNALKFTQKEGTIIFAVEKLKENEKMQTLQFSVKDNGIGIPKDRHEAIFESFTQADSSTTRKFGGTGLGLSISSSLAKLMGSSLELISEKKQGSTFLFSLDLLKESVKRIIKNKEEEPLPTDIEFDLEVLIVEDYDINQILIQTLLDNFNIRSDIANNGQEAVEMSRLKKYDLILMDINMPIMNGIDATYIIKKEDMNPVPIVALTANILDDDIRRGLEAGMSDSMIKPIQPKKLIDILKTYGKKNYKSIKKDKSPTEQTFAFQEAKDALGLPEKTLLTIIGKFTLSTKTLISDIESAVIERDLTIISTTAHKMKGSASTLCFQTIAEHAAILEKRPGDALEDSNTHVTSIKDALEAIENKLRNLS